MNIILIGDIMIDRNYYMTSSRNCPEDKNIPVCIIERSEDKLGGTANVAVNLKNLGHDVNLVSIKGDDGAAGALISQELWDRGFDIRQIIRCKNRKSVEKNRYYLGNKLIFRNDNEDSSKIGSSTENIILDNLKDLFNMKIDLVVISDYDKGLLTKRIVDEVKYLSNINNVRIIVDPKPNNIDLFTDVYLLKPNLNELSLIYKSEVNLDNILEASRCVSDKFNIDYIVTSLSKDGIYLYDKDNDTGKLYNNKFVNRDEVIDVTGAGDIVLSLIAHNIDDLNKAILEANKIAQESTKHLGVMYL